MVGEVRRERINVSAPFGLVEKEVEDGPIVPEIESRAAAELADICLNEFQMLTSVADPGLHMCKSCMGDVYDRYVREPGFDQLVAQT
jgi:hypothetical protein